MRGSAAGAKASEDKSTKLSQRAENVGDSSQESSCCDRLVKSKMSQNRAILAFSALLSITNY